MPQLRIHGVALALAAVALSASATPAHASAAVERYVVTVGDETARGWLAYPPDRAPRALLVFGHGCCGTPDQSATVRYYAEGFGAAAVAMDYRGPGHWDVMKGHEDLVAATLDLKGRFPSIERTVIWGVSMGGETTGMAVAARPDLFDYWVDTYGVVDLFQEFATLGLYPGPEPDDPTSLERASWIVEETGGTPVTAFDAYFARSPAFAANSMQGIRRAYLFHGAGDLMTASSQSREMFENLRVAQVPVSLYTTITGPGGTLGPYLPVGRTVPYLPTPAGPAWHDARGAGPSATVVADLLSGRDPDAGKPAVEHVIDGTLQRWATLVYP